MKTNPSSSSSLPTSYPYRIAVNFVSGLLEKTHKHECPNENCGLVWEHPDSCSSASLDLFAESHTCPNCGAYQNYKYAGYKEASNYQVCTNDSLESRWLLGE